MKKLYLATLLLHQNGKLSLTFLVGINSIYLNLFYNKKTQPKLSPERFGRTRITRVLFVILPDMVCTRRSDRAVVGILAVLFKNEHDVVSINTDHRFIPASLIDANSDVAAIHLNVACVATGL